MTTTTLQTGYKMTEIGVIPEDWEVKNLGEIGDSIIGLTYSPSNVRTHGKLVHRSSNIQNNQLCYNDNVFVDLEISEKLTLKEGDILICVRNGSRELIGKSALIKGRSVGETFGAFMSVFRAEKTPEFVFYLITSDIAQKQINQSLGATINQITNKTLNSFLIPLPPTTTEQQAIATVLSDTDELIRSLSALIAKKRQIKEGAMQELLTGKKRLTGFSGEWEVKKLGEIADFYKGKGLPKSDIRKNGKFKCVHYGELFTLYKERITTIKSSTNSKEGVILSKENDILMPTSDVTPNGLATASCIGTSGIVLGGDILIIRSKNNDFDGTFVAYGVTLNRKQIMQLVSGSTVYHLYGSDMGKYEFLCPPTKEEQQDIAQILSDMDSEITALEEKREKYRLVKQGMMQQLLTGKIRLVTK